MQIFIIIPGIDIPGANRFRPFNATTLAFFLHIARTESQQVAFIQLRAAAELHIPILMQHMIQITQLVFPLIRGKYINRRNRRIMLRHLRIPDIQLPIRRTVLLTVPDPIRIPLCIPTEMHHGIGTVRGMFSQPLHHLIRTIGRKIDFRGVTHPIRCQHADILHITEKAYRIADRSFRIDPVLKQRLTVNRHHIPMAAVNCRAEFPDLPRVRTKEVTFIRQLTLVISHTATFPIQL